MPGKGMSKLLWKQYRACNLLHGAESYKSLNKLQTKHDVENSSIQVENETLDASPHKRSMSQFRVDSNKKHKDEKTRHMADPSGTVTPIEYDRPRKENRMLKSSSAVQLKLKAHNQSDIEPESHSNTTERASFQFENPNNPSVPLIYQESTKSLQ